MLSLIGRAAVDRIAKHAYSSLSLTRAFLQVHGCIVPHAKGIVYSSSQFARDAATATDVSYSV